MSIFNPRKAFLHIIDENRNSLSGFSHNSKRLLLGILISAIGNGLILPYLFVYLNVMRGISPLLTGVLAACGGGISLLAAPFMGYLIDHLGPKKILLFGLILSFIGFLFLAQASNFISALIAILIEAIGAVAMWPAQSALAVQHLAEEMREKFFAAQFAGLNLGLGIGGLISSLIINLRNVHTFQWLYRLDATTFLIYFIVSIPIPALIYRSEKNQENVQRKGWAEVLADKKFIKFWIIAIFAIFLGYSQLELGFTSFSTKVAKVTPPQIAISFAFNTILITILQVPFLTLVKKLKNRTAVSFATLFWALAWVSLAIAVPLKNYAVFGVILCQIVFAFGEMIWSPITPAIVNRLAPEHLRGRYNSLMGSTWQIGAIAGPLVVGIFLNAHLEWLWISTLIAGLLILSGVILKSKIISEH